MLVSRVLARVSRTVAPRTSSLFPSQQSHGFSIIANQFHSIVNESPNKFVPSQASLFRSSSSQLQRFELFSSTASPEPSEKENGPNAKGEPKIAAETETKTETADDNDQTKESGSEPGLESEKYGERRRRAATKRTAFSDSDSESEEEALSMDELVKLVGEKEELLKSKHKEIEIMQDKVLRSYAEMENVMDRTRREAQNSKKYAIQSFAKSLLDVADNLGRASSVVKESFSKIDPSQDSTGAAPLLKTLLEGVEMTEKQLSEVFKKYGVEKYESLNEPFDPHRHNAMFQLSDPSKPPGTVAVVLKPGYMLHERVIRPAEVGVTVDSDDSADKE